jgi:hypothetical protein
MLGPTVPAQALPGDTGFEPLTPADGAALPVADDGIPVVFTCPVYRMSDPGFPVFGGASNYGVSLAESPRVAGDSRLADPVAQVQGVQDGADRCTVALGAGGAAPRPQETPGTYYWQVWRLCTGCPGNYEVGPVRRLVLRATAKLSLRPPKRVFGGYPFILGLDLAGLPDSTPIRVERRSRRGWVRAGSATALGQRGEAVLTVPRGVTRLRAAVTLGSELVRSPEVSVAARAARGWKTGVDDVGRYRGRSSLRLRVASRGRLLRQFSAAVPMLCPTAGMIGQFTTQIGVAKVPRVKIAPDGSFVGVATPEAATSIRIRGRLRDRRIRAGRVEISVGPCQGSAAFSARRVPGD